MTSGSEQPLLTVVVPVYNLQASIGENVRVIHDRVSERLEEPFELILVSDGSVDRTEEVALETALSGLRVLHYDRNLGKGYAIKVGALEATGRWVGYVDADLDLDPASLADYVRVAEVEELDFAIGSKRHPGSQVHYPASRRVASWLFQRLVRLLFRFDVRDTQVGLKVFRREVVDDVMPFLLVKRFAFDIELLAVARAFGFDRVSELPVTLDYRFTGSGVRSGAVARALLDTAAIFYRLRILRTYQRNRALVGRHGWTRPRGYRPSVSLVASQEAAARLDYAEIEVVDDLGDAQGEVVAIVEEGGMPAANWLSATIPFLARDNVAAVVTPSLAPLTGSIRERAAAAVRESRLGGGSRYLRYIPGKIGFVREFPGTSVVVRRDALLELGDCHRDEICERLDANGSRVIYTPESFVVAPVRPLWRPHLDTVRLGGAARAAAVQRNGLRSLHLTTVAPLALALWIVPGAVLVVAGPVWRDLWLTGIGAYLAAVALTSAIAVTRFRSLSVGAVAAGGLVATHAAYLNGLVGGFMRFRRHR